MAEIQIKDREGNVTGTVEINPLDIPVKGDGNNPLYYYVKAYLANQRAGTASTKTRGEVSGGGKKPWRQKGTGRARVGSIRSPLWRGGGIIFGPKPRNFSQKITKSLRLSAYRSAMKRAIEEGKITLVESLDVESHKTKDFKAVLEKLSVKPGIENILIVVNQISNNLYLSSRNIPDVCVLLAKDVNPYDLLWAEKILVDRASWETLIERTKKKKGIDK